MTDPSKSPSPAGDNDEFESFRTLALHELRGPLNSSLALAQLLLRRYANDFHPEAKAFVEQIVLQLKRMGALVTDLATFTGAVISEAIAEPVPLDGVIQQALANLEMVIKKSGAQIVIADMPIVLGSQAQFTQVFQNLIGNAIHYKSIDVPRITITAQCIGNECSVCVRDNGIGFSPEFAEQLFQPFKRLHGIDIPGSGLGLATSKSIIERSNGRIWAESQPGEGSTFYLTLPLASV